MPILGPALRRAAAALVLGLAVASAAGAPAPAVADLDRVVNDAIVALGEPTTRAERRIFNRLQAARDTLATSPETVEDAVAAALAASNRLPASLRSSTEFVSAISAAISAFRVDAEPAVADLQQAVDSLGLPPSRVRRVQSQIDQARRQLENALDDATAPNDRMRAMSSVFRRVQLAQDRLNALIDQMANAACDEPERLGMQQVGSARVTITGRASPVVITGAASGDGIGNTSVGDFNGTLNQGGREISFHFLARAFTTGEVPFQQDAAEFSFYENGTNYRATSGGFRITRILNRRYERVASGPGVVSRYVTIHATFTGTVQNSGDAADTMSIQAEFSFCEIPYYYLP